MYMIENEFENKTAVIHYVIKAYVILILSLIISMMVK